MEKQLLDKNLSAQLSSIMADQNKDAALLQKLRRDNVDKTVFYLGTGTCGLGAGAGKTLEVLRQAIANANLDAEIVEVGCIGLCAMEPILDIHMPNRPRLSYGHVTADNVEELVSVVVKGNHPLENFIGQYHHQNVKPVSDLRFVSDHPFFKPQTRIVLDNCGKINPGSIVDYIAWDGYKALSKVVGGQMPQIDVCEEVLASGLKGRGGGGFPTGMKWKFAQKENADHKYMVCNADEGDPGAFMDRAVIEGDPHRLLEGLTIAAYAIGAQKAYIYIRAEYPLAIKRLQQALAEARELGLTGDNILGTNFSLEVIIKMGAGAFVCGEETALLRSIEGSRGMPTARPPFPAVKGLFGKPTVINNVETLANVPDILRKGASFFNALGTENSKGTKVFALSGNVTNTGLVEIAMGTPMRVIIEDIGGGVPGGYKFKAAQIGGPSGGCIPMQHLDIKIDYQSLQEVGAIMGSGGLVVMDERSCMVDVAKFFMDFIQRESCGKCTPCREGTLWMLETLKTITDRTPEDLSNSIDRKGAIAMMQELGLVIKDSSLCGLGQTSPNPVLSTMRWFPEEYAAHINEERCPAKVCKGLLIFNILAEKCIGCGLCARKCPTAAIVGEKKNPYSIIQAECIKCGNCMNVCPTKAISVN